MRKADLKVGRWYWVEVKRPALAGSPCGGRVEDRTPGAPPSRCHYRMQLTDFVTNGRAQMVQVVTDWAWNKNSGSFGDAMAGRISKWAVKKNRFQTVTLGQIVGLAQPAPEGATSEAVSFA